MRSGRKKKRIPNHKKPTSERKMGSRRFVSKSTNFCDDLLLVILRRLFSILLIIFLLGRENEQQPSSLQMQWWTVVVCCFSSVEVISLIWSPTYRQMRDASNKINFKNILSLPGKNAVAQWKRFSTPTRKISIFTTTKSSRRRTFQWELLRSLSHTCACVLHKFYLRSRLVLRAQNALHKNFSAQQQTALKKIKKKRRVWRACNDVCVFGRCFCFGCCR